MANGSKQTSVGSPNSFEFTEGSVGEKTDYVFILNRQLDRINYIATYPSETKGSDFSNAVDVFDIMLEPSKDEIFGKDIEKLKEQVETYLKRFTGEDKQLMMEQMSHDIAKERLRFLMKLMSRKGYIPASRVSSIDKGGFIHAPAA